MIDRMRYLGFINQDSGTKLKNCGRIKKPGIDIPVSIGGEFVKLTLNRIAPIESALLKKIKTIPEIIYNKYDLKEIGVDIV